MNAHYCMNRTTMDEHKSDNEHKSYSEYASYNEQNIVNNCDIENNDSSVYEYHAFVEYSI